MRPFVAFDTATDHIALAVGDMDAPGVVVAAHDFPAHRAANTAVLPAVQHLLAGVGFEPDSLAAVAVGRGPGSFTGVRIGVAAAKGLAYGLGVPLAGFSTLDAVARMVDCDGYVGVVGDAMRGEVYPALFRVCAGVWERLSADRVAAPLEVAAEWALLGEHVNLTGCGLAKHRGAFESAMGTECTVVPDALWSPDGESLVGAAWASEGPGSLGTLVELDPEEAFETAHPGAILPIYTRLADAEEAERLRAGGADVLPRGGVAGPAGVRDR